MDLFPSQNMMQNMSSLILPNIFSPTGVERHSTGMAEDKAVHISPDCSAPRSSGVGPQRWNKYTASSAVLAEPNMVLRPSVSPQQLFLGDSCQEEPSVTSGIFDFSPRPEIWNLWVWSLRRPNS